MTDKVENVEGECQCVPVAVVLVRRAKKDRMLVGH